MIPDYSVRQMLANMPMRKAVLTNSNVEHAERVLNHLKIQDCFEKIIDIKALNFVNKPCPTAYELALNMMGGIAPNKAMLVEDSAANTRTAKAMGMTTVLVDCPPSNDADHFVDHVNQVHHLILKLQ